jgi:hypothetical protein
MKNENILRTAFSLPFVILLLMFLLSPLRVEAQVYNGNLTLSTQAQVDAFAWTEIKGNLTIRGANITNIDSLNSLTFVEKYLSIYDNPSLTNIDGLGNLNWVFSLGIWDNDALTNIDGLAGLTSVPEIGIGPNLVLNDLKGLSNLTSLGGLYFWENPLLTNLDFLPALTTVDILGFYDNPVLTNIDGLTSLTSVDGDLEFYNNPALTNINGLANLTSVGSIWIHNNDALTDLGGLASITSVKWQLSIRSNNVLADLDGLSSLTHIGIHLRIQDNQVLSNIDGLSSVTYIGANLRITDNPALLNIDGLSSVTSLGNPLRPWLNNLDITNNVSLNRFCGLYNVLTAGFSGSYTVTGNADNPTRADILNEGHCSEFILINALSDQTIGFLNDGDILDLASLPTNQLAIRANLEGPDVVSVRFSFQNVAKYRIENFVSLRPARGQQWRL